MNLPSWLPEDILEPFQEVEKELHIEISLTPKEGSFYIPVCKGTVQEGPLETIFEGGPAGTWVARLSSSLPNKTASFDYRGISLAEQSGKTFQIRWDFLGTAALFEHPLFENNAELRTAYIQVLQGMFCWLAEKIKQSITDPSVDHISDKLTGILSSLAERQFSSKVLELGARERDISVTQTQLINLIAQYEKDLVILTDISLVREELKVGFVDQLKTIQKHRLVTSMSIENNSTLCVFTSEITWKEYLLGRYKLCLTLGNESSNIIVVNLDRNPSGYSHPHYHGHPCWGGFGNVIMNNLAAGHFDMAMYAVLDWLTAIAPTDPWGQSIRLWPKVKGK